MSDSTAATNITDWPEPEVKLGSISGLTLLVTSIGYITIGFMATFRIIGVINERNVEHASQGLPALLAAFGAIAVAVGVAVKLFEEAWKIRLDMAQIRLSAIKKSRFERVATDPEDEERLAGRIEWQEKLEREKADAVSAAAALGARWRSFAAGLEFGGAGLLASSAVSAAVIWNWS